MSLKFFNYFVKISETNFLFNLTPRNLTEPPFFGAKNLSLQVVTRHDRIFFAPKLLNEDMMSIKIKYSSITHEICLCSDFRVSASALAAVRH